MATDGGEEGSGVVWFW